MISSLINNRYLSIGLGLAALLELISFIGYFAPFSKNFLFIAICLAFAFFALKKLFWGVAVLVSELAIGGHGYLISFELFDFNVAVRHIFLLILLTVFLYKIFLKKIDFSLNKKLQKNLLFLGVVWFFAIIIGLLNGNALIDVFLDSNAYLFFIFILPFFYILNQNGLKPILNILFGGLAVMSIKTLLTLFIFSHQLDLAPIWYIWVRDLRFGEVTYVNFSFYRVFFQSQVFLILALFVMASYYVKQSVEITFKEGRVLFILASLFLASYILSLSRSFWFAVILGGIMWVSLLYKDKSINKKLLLNLFKKGTLVFGVALIILISLQSQFFGVSVFTNRLDNDEAAAVSRWALLPKMVAGITSGNIIFGSGFGTRITYQTSDPRIIAQSSGEREYSTYSLEWGYLDIWLKMGLVGIFAWFMIFVYIFRNMFEKYYKTNKGYLLLGIISAQTAIIAANIFTPYLNHPLGIAFLAFGL